jgi:hypothetical protein
MKEDRMNYGVAWPAGGPDIRTFVRNRYFYGKLLDVGHFEIEQSYFKEKRWLLNRLVTGYGVVCGLNVGLTEESKQLWVDPGVAIDKAGREIVVPVRSKPVPIPEVTPPTRTEASEQSIRPEHEEERRENAATVYICYHECPGDPEPIQASDCEDPAPCSNGSVRERYTIEIRPGEAERIETLCEIEDFMHGNRLSHRALAKHITECCPPVDQDPCIALAEIRLPYAGETASPNHIDITVRPIVYTNDLLFELLLGMSYQLQPRPKGGKS